MKKILALKIFLSISLVLGISYASNYTNAKGEPNAISIETASYIIEIGQNGRELIYKMDTPDEFLPIIGEIVHALITPATPNGFLGKVKSIEKVNGGIKVMTESISLAEAFQNLSVRTGEIDITDTIEGVYDANGNPVEYEIITHDE